MQAAPLTGLLLIHRIEETCVRVCTAGSAKPPFFFFFHVELTVDGISSTESRRVATHSPTMASSALLDIMRELWLFNT